MLDFQFRTADLEGEFNKEEGGDSNDEPKRRLGSTNTCCINENCFGKVPPKTAFLSSDTRFDRNLIEKYVAPSRLTFHDVQVVEEPDPVHALLSELRTLPERVRRKMHLYHYGDTWDDPTYTFVDREFAGFAQPHLRYVLFE